MQITLAGSAATYEPNDDQLTGVSIDLAAFDGETGQGLLPFPDPSAGISVSTGRQAKTQEAGTILSDGFVLDQDRIRGPQPAGTARQHGFGITDANALLGGFRVARSRGAETDYARVAAFAALDGPTWDTTWVLNSSTVTLPAKKYDGDGGWSELIADVVEFTGKTLFLHDKAAGGRCLHYHLLTTGHTCGLSISDVAADSVTVFYPQSPQRQLTSADLRNDIKGRDSSGRTSFLSDSTSITAHDADGLQHQAVIDFDATSQADLNAKTAAFLASQKDDAATYLCSIGPLDGTALARIRVGDIITVTSSVLGLTASPQRIAHMTLSPTAVAGSGVGSAAGIYWTAALEMGSPVRRRARVRAAAAIAHDIAPFIPPPYVTEPLGSTETWQDSNQMESKTISRYQGTSDFGPPGDYTDPGAALDVFIQDIPFSIADPVNPYEISQRSFLSHDAPMDATFAKLSTRVYGHQSAFASGATPRPFAEPLLWTLYEGTWGGGTPAWGSIGSILASGSVDPDTGSSGGIGDHDALVDVIVPASGGRVQMVMAFSTSQTHVNSDDGMGGMTSEPRYPLFPNTADQTYDELLTAHPTTFPDSGMTYKGYTLDYFGGASAPETGQSFQTTTNGDGVTTLFTADFPYREITRVIVSGVDVTDDVTMTSPGVGTITFGHAPPLGASITIIATGA